MALSQKINATTVLHTVTLAGFGRRRDSESLQAGRAALAPGVTVTVTGVEFKFAAAPGGGFSGPRAGPKYY